MGRIHFAKPDLGKEEIEAVAKVIDSGWITQGPKVSEFENAFARRVGAPFACAVSNCTSALHLALSAAGVKPGDVVVTASLSFIATANAVRHCGAEPVFVDVDPATCNICPGRLAECLERDFVERDGSFWFRDAERLRLSAQSPLRTVPGKIGRLAAILPVHQLGMPADVEKIVSLGRRHGAPVVEDAACAIGSEIKIAGVWQAVGAPLGDMACFSFHPRKVLSTGDGGMITTASAGHDRTFRLLRQHGMSIPDTARHSSDKVIFEEYSVTGYNYRMTDIQAAVGTAQLSKLDRFVAKRRSLAASYNRLLAELPEITLPVEPEYGRSNWQSYQILLPNAGCRTPVMERLLAKGIPTRRGVMCCHREPPYRRSWERDAGLRHSEEIQDRGIILPLHTMLEEDDLRHIVEALICEVSQAGELKGIVV